MNVDIKSIDLTNVIGTSYYDDTINASAMNRLDFQPVLLNRTKYDSCYLNCRVICKAYQPVEGHCICAEDLYVRRYVK